MNELLSNEFSPDSPDGAHALVSRVLPAAIALAVASTLIPAFVAALTHGAESKSDLAGGLAHLSALEAIHRAHDRAPDEAQLQEIASMAYRRLAGTGPPGGGGGGGEEEGGAEVRILVDPYLGVPYAVELHSEFGRSLVPRGAFRYE